MSMVNEFENFDVIHTVNEIIVAGKIYEKRKIIYFLQWPKWPVNENSERELNYMPQPLYFYLSGSAFLVGFTDPNKQFLSVKPVFKFPNHGLNV